MPAPISSEVKLKQCVFQYSELARQSDAEFIRLWRIAFLAFKQMGLNSFWAVKTLELEVEDSKVAFIPPEVIQWIKVGNFNSNGELQTLRINPNITTFHADLPNRLEDIVPEIQNVQNILQGDYWFNGNGLYYGRDNGVGVSPMRFGLHSRLIQAGECNIDMTQRVIALNTDYQYQHVILEALVSPEMDDDYSIPMQFEMAMIAWLGYMDSAYLPSTSHINNNNNQSKALMFKAQLAMAKRAYKPFRLQEAYQVAIESQMLAPKP